MQSDGLPKVAISVTLRLAEKSFSHHEAMQMDVFQPYNDEGMLSEANGVQQGSKAPREQR